MTDSYFSSKQLSLLSYLLLLIPISAYLYVSIHYPLNIPFIDDFGSLLNRVNSAAEATTLHEWMVAMFNPNAGHTPFLTRLILLVEGLYLGGINFKYSLIAGNIGLILAAITLVIYTHKKYTIPLILLTPIPFLLLSITHWEQMDFLTPAWQMSWGSVLLPILCFIAITENRPLTAGLMFASAAFFSAGGYALCPLAGFYYIVVKRDWKSCLKFGFISGLLTLPLWFFSFFVPVEKHTLDIVKLVHYFPAFMGNIISTGQYDLSPYVVLHRSIGVIITILGIYSLLKIKGHTMEKMLFIYTIILGLLAAYVRGSSVDNVPPRYSLFAMLALISIYVMFVNELNKRSPIHISKIILFASVSIFLWGHSYYQCIKLLEFNKNYRTGVIKQYLAGDKSAMSGLLWVPDFAENELARAKKNGFYDFKDALK